MNFLAQILAAKRAQIARAKTACPLAEIMRRAAARPDDTRGFAAALDAKESVRVIAEIKRASPSRGDIDLVPDPATLAQTYQANGAAALSVLTEQDFFKGSLRDLRAARDAVALPVLRKDFVIDDYQIYEARAHGADAILLIVRIIDNDEKLAAFHALATRLGMDVLTEVFDETDCARAANIGAKLVGINNRDLDSFATDITHSAALMRCAGESPVALSGIASAADIATCVHAGIRRFLIGEALVKNPALLKEIVNT